MKSFQKTSNESQRNFSLSLTQALFYAPLNPATGEDELNIDFALCLANRCASFLQLQLYEHCLTDIDLAINYNYPANKRKKLEERRAFCLERLQERTEAAESPNEPKLINLTSATAGRWSDKPVTSEHLKAGQIVLEESAFCKTIGKLKYYERCFNCLRKTGQYVYPCRGCSQIKFCSESCSNEAWSAGHFIECNKIAVLDTFKSNFPFEVIQLALKCLLKTDLARVFDRLRNEQAANPNEAKEETNVQATQAVDLNANVQTFLNLLKHQPTDSTLNEQDYKSVAQIVTYLVDVCEIPKRLVPNSPDISADIELFGAVLARQLNQLRTGALAISQLDLKVLELKHCPHSTVFQPFEESEIGKAIFPVCSQLKPDPAPNCQILCFSDNRLTVSALREIASGEELTIKRCADSLIEHGLVWSVYREKRDRYQRLVYRYAFKCIKCADGAMCIFDEGKLFYLDCLGCGFSEEIEKSEEPVTEPAEPRQLDRVNELIGSRRFFVNQCRKAKLLLYSKQPDLRTVEHNLLESFREMRSTLFASNLCLAEVEFDLAICYVQMRMYMRSIKHAMNAIAIWKSHYSANEIQYLNGLIRLATVQYYFVRYTNETNKELPNEHIALYNFNLNDLQANLNFLIEHRFEFFGEPSVQQSLLDAMAKWLSSVKDFTKKSNS